MAIRRAVFAQQTRSSGDQEAPFILEAALQYRMTREVYQTGNLASFDPRVQYPEGVNRWKTYSIGAEFIYAPLAKLLPSEWTLVARLRWISTALFCLAIPLAALWAGLGWKSWWAGITCGLILMVSPAFAVRSSGLALSRENLAFPVMMLFLAMDQLTQCSSQKKRVYLYTAIAGIAAGLSQSFWDFSQYLFGLWALAGWLEGIVSPVKRTERRSMWCSVTLGLGLAGVMHPYLRGQGFLFSPVMILLIGLCLSTIKPLVQQKKSHLILGFLAFAIFWVFLGRVFVTNYSHFGELFWAKIIHLNAKPFDPSVLSYPQRIMWTPALNSTTWLLTKAYLPSIMPLLLLGVVFLFRGFKQCTSSFSKQLLLYALVTLPMYVLFFRLHVYLIVFAGATIGGMMHTLATLRANSLGSKIVATGALLFITGFEVYRLLFFEPSNTTMNNPEQVMIQRALEEMGVAQTQPIRNRWGHPGQSYEALRGLTSALKHLERSDAPVLAGFGVSGSILADTGMPILLHPKFESPGIRERVREFYESLYLRTEREFRDWAVVHGAEYYVHAFGALAGSDPRETPRYMVDAVEPPQHAAVHLLERNPREATWFQPIWSNERYQIMRIITDADVEFADTLMELAYSAARRGQHDHARRLAWRVLSDYHWKHQGAVELIGILGPPRENDR